MKLNFKLNPFALFLAKGKIPFTICCTHDKINGGKHFNEEMFGEMGICHLNCIRRMYNCIIENILKHVSTIYQGF